MMDNDPQKKTPGLRLIPKLKYERINMTSVMKMRVDLNTQVTRLIELQLISH